MLSEKLVCQHSACFLNNQDPEENNIDFKQQCTHRSQFPMKNVVRLMQCHIQFLSGKCCGLMHVIFMDLSYLIIIIFIDLYP